MLLWLLSSVNLRLRSARVFMSTFSDFIMNLADVNVIVMARASVVRTLLFFLAIFQIASVDANIYENDPSLVAFCDDSSMHLSVEFSNPFHGLLYTSGDRFIPSCSFPASPQLNNTKLMLTLPFRSCTFDVSALDEDRISIFSTFVVQQHRMVKTSYDTSLNATCVLSLPMNTFQEWYYPNTTLTAGHLYTNGSSTLPKVTSRLETRIGSDLFPDDSEVEADLFFVISIRDGGENKDMSIENCVAHDDGVLTSETMMYELSDVFGCPNASYTLKNFTVSNQTDGTADLMAYTRLEYLSLIAIGELFVSCGVVMCKNSCQMNCEANGPRSSHHLNNIVVKKFVRRHPGATIPSSLEDFDRRQNSRISKRSVVSSRFSLNRVPGYGDKILDKKSISSIANGTVWLQTKSDTDIAGILTDSEVGTLSQDHVEKVRLYFSNETTRLFKKLKTFVDSRKVWDQVAVSLLMFVFLACYCGLLFWTRT